MSSGRTLVLLRHAKAERPDGQPDLDRSLTDRGYADAGAAGAWLATQGHVPDLVICSPAKRTRQTWHSVAVAMAESTHPVVRYERAVYDGTARDLLELIRQAEDGTRTLLLIGHNPSVSDLSALLDPTGDADSDGLRTGGVAVHTVSGAWTDCGPRLAPLAATHTARA
ncbi:MAG TPA: histidine phosphatase family protein [Micromonosporaceae bacterium]|nr:histidine phosphatase family protein [Micromonosporaceae bacterium]